MFTRQQLAGFRPQLDEIRGLGAELVFVGNGTPDQAAAFREEHRLDFPLYTDPTLTVHRAARFTYGRKSSFAPKALLNAAKAFAQGFRQEFVAGDPMQQGGVLVVLPGDRLAYVYRSREAGDHPDPRAVVTALTGALSGGR